MYAIRSYYEATGEIAVIDGSTNTVLTYIDLTLNGDPQSPYQVAIDEAQNIIYVGAKSPEPEPYALIPDANGKYGCMAIRELPSDEVPGGEDVITSYSIHYTKLYENRLAQTLEKIYPRLNLPLRYDAFRSHSDGNLFFEAGVSGIRGLRMKEQYLHFVRDSGALIS